MVYFTVKCNFRTVFPVTATNLVCAPWPPPAPSGPRPGPASSTRSCVRGYGLDEATFNIDINIDTQYSKKAPTNTLLTCVC